MCTLAGGQASVVAAGRQLSCCRVRASDGQADPFLLATASLCNAAARNCLAFGPGLLPSVVCGVQVPFLIQALDTLNEHRASGGDRFAVHVVSPDGKLEGDVTIRDMHDGKYEVHFSVPLPGPYLVHASYADLGGSESIPLRGSPFRVEATDPWTRHRLLGVAPARAKVCVRLPCDICLCVRAPGLVIGATLSSLPCWLWRLCSATTGRHAGAGGQRPGAVWRRQGGRQRLHHGPWRLALEQRVAHRPCTR